MEKYLNYSVKKLATDDFFIAWVKSNDPRLDAQWQQWLDAYPHKRAEVAEARRLVLQLSENEDQATPEEIREIWEQVNTRRRGGKPASGKHPAIRRQMYSWQPVAAVFVALVVGTALLLWLLGSSGDIQQTTAYGETRQIRLPDGSTVVLNANSTLRYQAEWDEADDRMVSLEGEAFFQVQKKPQAANAKFRVRTGQVEVVVLGTQFNLSERNGKTQVVLREGKVQVHTAAHTDTVTMLPGEMVVLEKQTTAFRKQSVRPEQYTSWLDRKITFNNTPLSEVAELLEHTYGLQVTFEDTVLAERRIAGTIPLDNADLLLVALSKTSNLRIERKHRQVIIKHKNNSP